MSDVGYSTTDKIDGLTGLLNMWEFRNRAEKVFMESDYKNLAMIYYDIDNFKFFNDRHGYEAGDHVLVSIAKELQELYPQSLISRFSDDHFLVLTQRDSLEEKIHTMHKRIHELQKESNLELKAGIYLPASDCENVSAACDRAKLANNSIKKIYNEDFCYFSTTLMEKANRQLKIEAKLDKALRDGSITVYYQPVVRVITGNLVSVEALARWNDRELGTISPEEFIPLLEERHLIHQLDCNIIKKVFADARKMQDWGIEPIPFSINVSRTDFLLCNIHDFIEEQLAATNIDRKLVHIEITESALADDPSELKRHINLFKEQGFEVWLDDFGSDYSSLNVLKEYDFDLIKVDMKFMSDFENNPKSKTILTSIVDMAKQLGIQTLTEGIETREQLLFLKNIGCDKAQGFMFGKAAPAESFRNSSLTREEAKLTCYYDDIGKLNMMSQRPLSSIGKNNPGKQELSGVPMAIVEWSTNNVRFLAANQDFNKVLESIFIDSLEEAEKILNNSQHYLYKDFSSLALKGAESGMDENMDFIHNGDYCNIQTKCIAKIPETQTYAFAVILQNLSRFTNLQKMENLDEMLRFLFTMFNSIHLISREEATAEKLYMGSTMFKSYGKQDYRESIKNYGNQMIHPNQLAHYMNFFEYDKLWQTIDSSSSKYISGFFKTKVQQDKYEWKMYAVIPFKMREKDYALNCQADLFFNTDEHQPILKEISDFFISRVQGLF